MRDMMPKNEKVPDLVQQPKMSDGATEVEDLKDTKNSKQLKNKPGMGILRGDGIAGRIK